MTGVLHSWAFLLAAGAGAGVWWLIDRAYRRDTRHSSDRCVCIHPRAMHQHYRPGSDCGKCDCPEFVAAVERVRSLRPPRRDAITTHPRYDTAAMDRMVDDAERGER